MNFIHDQEIFKEGRLSDCLFGAVNLNNNVEPDKCGYTGYGTGFFARYQ